MARGGQRQAAIRRGWRGRGQSAGRGQQQPTMRSPNINGLTREIQVVGVQDFQVPHLLKLCRGSVTVAPSPTIIPYIRDVGFEGPLMLTDFNIDGPLLSSFVEGW
ncbi:hypothetical protein PIB30_030819 [Stylosanthes scabra]|uniref:Uncharacterized protein n=1 Tax=Stylosanthes scabra TaxID=79078 RepID=A0ABU6SCI4_9FABA|nr:hypothetical protein [Stylosanthes scabra]